MSKQHVSKHFSRRTFLKSSLAAAVAAALPMTQRALAKQRESASWARAEAQAEKTVKILALAWPSTGTEQKLADEVFTPDTGIKVVLEAVDYGFLEQRVKQLVASKDSTYDVYHYDSQWIGGFVLGGALERLDTDQFLNNSATAIKFDDFYPEIAARLGRYPSVETALRTGDMSAVEGVPIYGLPWSLNCEVLWWRNDLVDAAPTTWAELRDMAKTLTNADHYGMAYHATRASDFLSVEYLPLLWANGGDIWDSVNWVADGYINSDAAVAAIEYMRDMWKVDKSVDPASGNWGFNERLAALLNGKTAMAQNWAPLFGDLPEQAASSSVVGKINYAVVPKGDKGQNAMFGCQGTGINGNSTQKDEAWQYLQWLLSKDTQSSLMHTMSAGFISSRLDLQDEASGVSPWHKAFVDSIGLLRDFWNNGSYAELLDTMARGLNLAYIDRVPAKQALDDVAINHQVIYDSSPENPKNKQ
jgi:ABC-type glycerol-3-phosphate transport system substrate-binding protein